MINLKLLFIIIDEGFSKKITTLLNAFGIKVKVIASGNGTASPSVLDYFELVERKKEIFMAVIPDYLNKQILDKLDKQFDLKNAGTGISFILPISSGNKFLTEPFNKIVNERNDLMENENIVKHHLIITIVAEGYLEQVMAAAKRAGSAGGTALKGRGLSNSTPAKILGFNIEPEKDIVFNVVEEKIKNKVMEEITKEVGIKTRGKGICISIPVEDAVGFGLIS